MYCINCGKELREGAKFCSNCGTPVPDAQTAHSEPEAEAPKQTYSQPVPTVPSSAKKKNTGIIIAIAIAAVAIIAAIAVIAGGGKGGSGGLSANAVGKLNGTYVEQSGVFAIQFKKNGDCSFAYSYTDSPEEVTQGTYTIGDGNRIYFSDEFFGNYEFIYDEKADVINCEELFLTFYRVKDEKALADDGDNNGEEQRSKSWKDIFKKKDEVPNDNAKWKDTISGVWVNQQNEEFSAYSIDIPSAWGDVYNVIGTTDSIDGLEEFFLNFYCIPAQEDGGEYYGKLFSIGLLDSGIDYEAYGIERRYIGEMKSPVGKTFNLIVDYPSDVQYTPDTSEVYNEMFSYADAMIKSIRPLNGYTYFYETDNGSVTIES